MLFMNEFLQQHWNGMRGFLQTVSSQVNEIPMTSFDGYVDLPLRLAVLHGLLVDIIYQRGQVGWKTNGSPLVCYAHSIYHLFVPDVEACPTANCLVIVYTGFLQVSTSSI